jgi:hypothetical protein
LAELPGKSFIPRAASIGSRKFGIGTAYDSIAWDGGQFVVYNSLGRMAVSKDGTE